MSSTGFVHPQEVLYVQCYGIFSCVRISRLVDVRMCTYPDINQTAYTDAWKNTITLHVQNFLRMTTWLYKTCRRQYKWIESLMKKCAFCWCLLRNFHAFCMSEVPGWCQDVYISWHQPGGLYGCMKNIITLHVKIFLRMTTWLFKTCRRLYNWIKSLMKNVCILLALTAYVYHDALFKKRKVCMKINCFQMVVSPRYTFYQVKFYSYK